MKSKLNLSVDSEVGADKRLDRGSVQLDDRTQGLIDHITEYGYVAIPNAFDNGDIEEAKAEVQRLASAQQAGGASLRGRNTFEGLKTQRIYALANKSRIFDKFALHPDVLALNDYFLDRGYLLTSFQSINIESGEAPQTLHYDDGYVTVPRPHRPFGAAIMVPLDPYTSTNGATVIVPKSHTWGADRIPDRSETTPVIIPSGSIMYFLSTLWHGGGKNTSGKDRMALTVQYCQPWMRQLENQLLAVEWEKLNEMPELLVDMLGYKVGAPFIGHVDGNSPRAAVNRLLEHRRNARGTDPRL